MKLVVDTNIVFSALIHQGNSMAEILLNPKNTFHFYAPSLLASELKRHEQKLAKLTSLPVQVLKEATEIILRRISLISEDLIEDRAWQEAVLLTADVDENDTPFVALSISLKAPLWTGDKKLVTGLRQKGHNLLVTTGEILSQQ